MKKHIEGCGACAIYDFKKIGISSLKILDRNLPSEEKVKAAKFIKKSLEFLENKEVLKKEFVNGLERLKRIFYWLNKKRVSCEVVVNDWGVLECLHAEFRRLLEPVFGRLMVRQQRDPAMKGVLEKQPPF